MGYVVSNLMPDEEIVYFGSVHWFIFVPGIVLIILGFVVLTNYSGSGWGGLIGLLIILYGFFSFVRAVLTYISTELAVTTNRVIAKVGLISRNTVELNHSKVESFSVDQSVTGRIFGFGTVVINGTGGGKTPIRSIDSPLEFRRQAMGKIDAVSRE